MKAYIAGARALEGAAERRDRKAGVEAVLGLRRSCGACHGYAVPR
jgi:hypothetical protein